MFTFHGSGVYGAIAIGKASVFKRDGAMAHRKKIEDVAAELDRLAEAKSRATAQIREIYQRARAEIGETHAQIFEIHMMMIDDEDYNESIRNIIETQHVNAEFAVALTGENFSQMFSSMDDGYMQARAADVKDISNRIVTCFETEKKETAQSSDKIIVCADDLAPSETVSLDKSRVLAFVTEGGSKNSHTAILSRNMNIPAVIGVGKSFLDLVRDGDILTVDGYTGEVTVAPSAEKLFEMQEKQRADLEKKNLLQTLRGKDNVTRDGRRINVYANIGSIDHIGAVLLNDAGGIGLFRSEFLYLEKNAPPTEDEQFFVYKRILEKMGGKKVIIRTLDVGADKQVDYLNLDKEENPALGLRGIRVSLSRPDLFKTQMKALYRAAPYGTLGVMFPMIVDPSELRALLALCEEAKADLAKAGIPYSDRIERGVMIETPAAAIISDRLAPMVDFFSIGTNDLTQYTLACDRQNSKLDRFCDTHHEAILRLIEATVKNAHAGGAWVGICGELAADLSLTEYFLNIGVDELSVSPYSVLKLRDVIRKI